MRRIRRSWLLAALVLPLGCGAQSAADDDDAFDAHPDDGGESRVVRFVNPGPVALFYRQVYVFTVNVTAHSTPVNGVRVDLALEDNAQDSSLDTTVLTTGPDGRAQGSLVAPTVSVPSDDPFTVRASLSTGETARLVVTTSPPGDVRVTLDPDSTCARNVPTLAVRLRPSAPCPTLYPRPDADAYTVTVASSDPTFSVPLGLLFAPLQVVVVGIDGGAELTWGCVADVTVPTAGLPSLPVTLTELPWPQPGLHDTEVQLPFGELAASVLAAALEPYQPLLDGLATPGALALDGIVAALRAAGSVPAAEVLEARRALDGLDLALDDVLGSLPAALVALHGAAATFLADCRVRGQVLLGEPDGTGNTTGQDRWVALHDSTGFELPLGVPPDPYIEGILSAAPGCAALELRQHQIPLSLGRVLELVLAWSTGADDPTDWSTAWTDWLATQVPCAAVTTALFASRDLATICDTACLQLACEAWRSRLIDSSATALAAAGTDYSTLVYRATCTFLDEFGRLVAGGTCYGAPGTVVGFWHGLAETPLSFSSGSISVSPELVL